MASGPSWSDTLTRLIDGDRLAFLELNRLITQFLVRAQVYDLRDEWDDLRQEVVIAVFTAARNDRLREPDAVVGFVKAIVRNKVADRLGDRRRLQEKKGVPWEEVADELLDAGWEDADEAGRRTALWKAVEELPAQERSVVRGIYVEGKTYESVAADTGIPLGTMKRRLRDALGVLRERFRDFGSPRDPIRASGKTSSLGDQAARTVRS
jgi:RNA polymerase sigma-70 factor (ECF subfamily)